MNILHIDRPMTGIRTYGTKKRIRTNRSIAYGNTAKSTGISSPFRFQMKPHDILVILLVIDHFRTFQNTAFRYAMCRIIRHDRQSDTFVFPIIQILGGITVNTDQGIISGCSFRLMLAKPVIGITGMKNTATVSIDMRPIVIRPQFTGSKYAPCLFCPCFTFTTHKSNGKQQDTQLYNLTFLHTIRRHKYVYIFQERRSYPAGAERTPVRQTLYNRFPLSLS